MPLAMGWKAKDAPTPRGRLIPPVFPHLISTASSSQGSRPAPCKPSSNQPAQRDRCCWDVVPSVGVSSNTKALHEPLLGLPTKSGGREMSPMGCLSAASACFLTGLGGWDRSWVHIWGTQVSWAVVLAGGIAASRCQEAPLKASLCPPAPTPGLLQPRSFLEKSFVQFSLKDIQ